MVTSSGTSVSPIASEISRRTCWFERAATDRIVRRTCVLVLGSCSMFKQDLQVRQVRGRSVVGGEYVEQLAHSAGGRVCVDMRVSHEIYELVSAVFEYREHQRLAGPKWCWITPHVTPARRATSLLLGAIEATLEDRCDRRLDRVSTRRGSTSFVATAPAHRTLPS